MTRKAYPAYAYRVIRVQRQASLDRQNFGPRHNFSILFLRFLWSGKFILAIIIFPVSYVYINEFCKVWALGESQCRERSQESFEMMKNISRKNDEIWSKNIFHQRTVQQSWDLRGAFPGPLWQFLWNIGHKFSTRSAHVLWHISRKNDEIWLENISHMRDVQLTWDPRGAFSGPAWQFSCITIFNLSTPSAHYFWHISRENDKIMTDLFFHEGTGLVI